jgi:hypothetical protein
MLFIILGAILTFALPLSLEIYKQGSNNVVARSGKELANTKAGSIAIHGPARMLQSFNDFAKGSLAIAVIGGGVYVLWKTISFIIQLVLYFFS